MPKALSDFCKEESSKILSGFAWAINYEFKAIPREDARDLNIEVSDGIGIIFTLFKHIYLFFFYELSTEI